MTGWVTVGPFNRVEGDLEVTLNIAERRVNAARVTSSLFRGFERLLQGRHPLDALVIVPRICGICSVSQSSAAAAALASATGLDMPRNGRLASNLILACENLADHLTHFYAFFMPDFARDAYRGRFWHADAVRRYKAVTGEALRQVLPARADLLRTMGHLAGKWPHSLALQPGGTTRAVTASERIRLLTILREFRSFLRDTVFGDTIERVAAIDSPDALRAWARNRPADLPRFIGIADDLGLSRVGRASDVFLSYGAYAGSGENGAPLFARGLWDGEAQVLAQSAIAEDVSHAWLLGDRPLHPANGETQPLAGRFADRPDAYTWCKAPRYEGRVVETGALARQMVDGHPLLRSLVAAEGGSVLARVVARIVELALVVPAMENWVRELTPGEPCCNEWRLPQDATGVGLVEAARGALGHWMRVEQGKIAHYQIIAPTTWNFSPRDERDVPGALEQALTGLPTDDQGNPPLAVQHVVRSFDPCMVCTVH